MKYSPHIRFARQVLLANLGRLPWPYKLTFAVTYKCNFKCVTCNIWKKAKANELSVDEMVRVFDGFPHFSWISLTGGEMFMRDDILEVLEAVVRKNPNLYLLAMNTNGYLSDRIFDVMNELSRMPGLPPRVFVTVSMDGPPSLHDQMRGVEGSWEQAVETHKRLSGLSGIDVGFGTTISHHNAKQIPDMIEAVQSVYPGIDRQDFHFNLFNTSSHYYGNEEMSLGDSEKLLAGLDTTRRTGGALWSVTGVLDQLFLSLTRRFLKTSRTPIPCEALRSSLFLDPCGTVFPCIAHDVQLGNVRDSNYDLAAVLSLDRVRQQREEVIHLRCPHCWTPCECYQSMLGHPWSVLRSLCSAGSRAAPTDG